MARKCPRCGRYNPSDGQRCDCGYDFETRVVEKPHLKPEDSGISAGEKSERVFGTVLGLNGAIFALSLLYVDSRTTLAWGVFGTLGGLLLVPLGLGAVLGGWVGGRGYFPRLGPLAVAGVVLLGWPAAAFIPAGLRILHADQLALNLIIYPGAQVQDRDVTPFDSDFGPAHVSVRMAVSASTDTVVRYYRAQLLQQGWKETQPPPAQSNLYFSRRGLTMEVSVQPAKDTVWTTVRVVCAFHPRSGWLFRFF